MFFAEICTLFREFSLPNCGGEREEAPQKVVGESCQESLAEDPFTEEETQEFLHGAKPISLKEFQFYHKA